MFSLFGNISLLAWLCVVWVFLTKARCNIYFTDLTRDERYDIFTNEFCGSCSNFSATEISSKSCRCKSSKSADSVFVRSSRRCMSGQELREAHCFDWDLHSRVVVNVKLIDVQEVNPMRTSYKVYTYLTYTSCQLTPFIAFRDAMGEWQPFNLSSDVLEVVNNPNYPYFEIKITRLSLTLTNLSGYVIKLNLNCTKRSNGESDTKCLMFRIKGVLKFPLCNYTPPTTTPPPPPPTTTATRGNSTICTTPSPPSTTTPPPSKLSEGIIAAVASIGTVLFLALIGAFVFLFKHHYICNSRSRRDVAREFNNFAVINNPGQQTYTVQEEPDYMELPEVYPSNGQIAGAEGEEDLDYQGLETGKRAKSMFICSSCNENLDYQRLSRLGHCPHEQNIEGKEKSPSFCESLTLESGTREFIYEIPAQDGEDEERDANQTPDYQILEPEETGAGEVLDASVDHDYNILEEAEPVNGELNEDNNNIGDPCYTDENSGKPLEPPGILHTEDNPEYAVPCKKTIADKSEPVHSELDEDNNKTSDPGPADENLEETFEPPELDQIDNNPLYAMPLKKNATEEPRRKRSYSM